MHYAHRPHKNHHLIHLHRTLSLQLLSVLFYIVYGKFKLLLFSGDQTPDLKPPHVKILAGHCAALDVRHSHALFFFTAMAVKSKMNFIRNDFLFLLCTCIFAFVLPDMA